MNQVTVQEVQLHLLELLKNLNPGEAVQIVAGEQVVGRLVAEAGVARALRQPGSAVSTLTIVAEDDDHLQDFANYMP
ncbi:antitoxin of toxin-antitoxin stability system [Nodosilinea sp. LEGE 07088]|uniref:antitoxin of toxin-antitoxin stability system n=1 Tax=Nodosilinea sp. LEGE 07088 TaxID=2777968 RepID=UPI0018829938|nr:antitoxin of toxin-antitoxin stability system [Nodosilinea sp. LEGE 07088]MBE9141155.1 antitoxin of toxin-antitoxin stability system [Nodosilinea sp. LEGE 07088]